MTTVMIGSAVEINGNPPICLPADAFSTHAFIAGSTGCGKTGMVLSIVEEQIRNKIPVILIDVKGDLGNIIYQPDSSAIAGAATYRMFSPGARHAEQINLMSGLRDPERITPTVTGILKLLGVEADPLRSIEHVFLSTLLQYRHEKGLPVSMIDLVKAIIDPGFDLLGALELDKVFGLKRRIDLASSLNTLMCSPSFEPWKIGEELNIPKMLELSADEQEEGKVPVIVYSVAHIVQDDERIFAISLLLDALVSHMRTSPGSDSPTLSVIIDECYGLMPAYPHNPPTKQPLLMLLKQARAFGIGLVLATQNPMDLDYKALSNCNTWIIGKLQTVKDRERILDGVCGNGLYNRKDVDAMIAGLQKRQFVLFRNNKTVKVHSRTIFCNLIGPMSPGDIKKAYKDGILKPINHLGILKQKIADLETMLGYTPSDAVAEQLANMKVIMENMVAKVKKEVEEAVQSVTAF